MLGLSKKKVVVVSPIRMKLRTTMFVDIVTISLWLYDFLWLADDYSLFLYDCLFKTKNNWWIPYIYEIIRDRHLIIISLSIYFFLAGFLFHMTFTIPRTAVKGGERFQFVFATYTRFMKTYNLAGTLLHRAHLCTLIVVRLKSERKSLFLKIPNVNCLSPTDAPSLNFFGL